MNRDLDRLLERLAMQPVPDRLNRLEADVMRRIVAARPALAATPAWRTVAVGLALAIGLGVGGAAVAVDDGSRQLGQELAYGPQLAPSTLLGGSE